MHGIEGMPGNHRFDNRSLAVFFRLQKPLTIRRISKGIFQTVGSAFYWLVEPNG